MSPDRPDRPDGPGSLLGLGERQSLWRGAGPEVAIAAITVAVAAIAGGAVAGWAGVATVAIAAAALGLVVLRGMIPRSAAHSVRLTQDKQEARSIRGYAQRRSVVASSVTSRSFYEADLRPVLEHLLAARLAERHGINLYQDPAAAMRAFCRDGGDRALWSWIDPAQALTAQDRDMHRDGISRRTLGRLINRLEQL